MVIGFFMLILFSTIYLILFVYKIFYIHLEKYKRWAQKENTSESLKKWFC